ncbi:MAG: cobyrinate a,c-diamide synthase [Eubacteriales bacterium]
MSKCKDQINRILIAGTHSGCGKTTVTCGILRALQKRKIDVRAFKCGPDYIDPMFHSEVIGTKSRNIDMFLCPKEITKALFAENSSTNENSLSLVEGVMGYYDGLGGNTVQNSTYHIAEEFQIPTILVVDCKGASISIVAMIQGYQNYKENHIVGVILNRVTPMMLPFYREMIEKETGLEVLGCLPKEPMAMIESRHLGLVTAQEIEHLNQKIEVLGELVEQYIDVDRLLAIGHTAAPFQYEANRVGYPIDEKAEKEFDGIHIAVARDKAFCFYYEDGLHTLETLGAHLHYFSPLEEDELPEEVVGIILGGGYPELYLETLSKNESMQACIRNAHHKSMPIYAECGGFMYLGKSIEGHRMVGIIDMHCEMTTKLNQFGYVKLTPLREGTFIEESLHAHEFHYSKSDSNTFAYQATKTTGKSWETGYSEGNIFAQYPHIHFSGQVELAKKFLTKCKEYKETEN